MEQKDFFDNSAFKKRMEIYDSIVKKSTPEQKKQKISRVDRFLKDNIMLEDIRKLVKLMNHCVVVRVTLFQQCVQIYLHTIQDLEDKNTKEHYQQLYTFIYDPKIRKMENLKEKYLNHRINRSFYKRMLSNAEQEMNSQIIQFIMFVLKGSLAYIDKKSTGSDEDYYGGASEDGEKVSTPSVPDVVSKVTSQSSETSKVA